VPSLAEVLGVADRPVTDAIDSNILFEESVETQLVQTNTLGENTNIVVPQSGALFFPEYKILNNSGFILTLVPDTDVVLLGSNLIIPANAIACIKEISSNNYSVTYQLNAVSGGGGDFVPLSGTTEGNPVTGDIEYGVIGEVIIDEEITNKGFYQNEGSNKSGFTFSSDGASSFPVIYNQVGPLGTSLVCSESGFVVDSVGASKGISSFNDYSEVDPTNKLIYAQRQYVDDAVANLLPLTRQQFTYTSGAQTFTLTEAPSAIYLVFVNGQELNTDQFSIATNVLTIIDTLISGDKVNILYSGQPIGVIPSYTKVETDALLDDLRITVITVATTGSEILFVTPQIYNSPASPSTANLTNDLTGAKLGVVQKIYHNHSVAPTFPGGWVLIGGEYKLSELNIIYAEWCGSSRVEYWIAQEI
jgi:hypothetical protein